MQISSFAPLDWLSSHWKEFTGWGVLAAAVYKVYCAVRKIVGPFEDIAEVKESMDTIRTNHLPHMQIELEKTNLHLESMGETMKDLRDDIRAVLTRLP